MDRALNKETPEFKVAVNALNEVNDLWVEDAAAEVLGPSFLKRLIDGQKIHKAKYPEWFRFLGKSEEWGYSLSSNNEDFPGRDHASLWLDDNNNPKIFTSEPYGIDMTTLEKLIKVCKENEIDFRIDAESPYFPGRTLLIKFFKSRT